MPSSLKVIFDINVFIDGLAGPKSSFPLIEEEPPTSGNWSADAISLAFDGEDFQLFASPHILRNMIRVLRTRMGYSEQFSAIAAETIVEIVHQSGGSIIEPRRHTSEIRDFEDNLILDLAVAVDALVVVTSDSDLLEMNAWNGRLVLNPKDFVSRVVRARSKPLI